MTVKIRIFPFSAKSFRAGSRKIRRLTLFAEGLAAKIVFIFFGEAFAGIKKIATFAAGKSYTASSLSIPQGLTAARAAGRSGAM